MSFDTINPYTGELLKSFPYATDEEIASTLTKAQAAFDAWKNVSIKEREAILRKAAEILRSKHSDYAKLLTLEMGKLFTEAEGEVELSAQILDYYAENSEALLAPTKIDSKHPSYTETWIEHVPQGILITVEPWNFPYYQIVRIAAPQLAAGNVIILKHAGNVPQCAAAFEEIFKEAGLPEGCFTNLYANHDQIKTIIEDPRLKGVALTGSVQSGAILATLAGQNLKKSTMELGGADAFVVLADADLDKTVEWAVTGRHWNAGQVCVSSKRIIVVDELYDAFLEKYKAGVSKLKAGDPMDPSTTLAPLSSESAKQDLVRQVESAVAHGAKVEVIGAEVPSQGTFFQPILISNLDDNNPERYTEFFGPVSQVFRAKDEADAIRIANDSPFGLGGSVFTQDVEHGKEVAAQITTGMVYINHPTGVAADLPFGGIGMSGYGRELVGLGINEFVNHKLYAVTDIDGAF